MIPFTPYQVVALFLVYSVLGWCVEVVYCTLESGKLTNRGFLNGPVCPIYGFGMVGILVLLNPLIQMHSRFLLFLGGVAITSTIELIGGWTLFRLFHARWWDYTERPFNLGGFICLQFSIVWGLGTLIMVDMVHPMVNFLILLPPAAVRWTVVVVFGLVMLADFVVSVGAAHGLSKQLKELEVLTDELRARSDRLSAALGKEALRLDQLKDEKELELLLAKAEGKGLLDVLGEDLAALYQRRMEALRIASRNLQIVTTPELKLPEYVETLKSVRTHARTIVKKRLHKR